MSSSLENEYATIKVLYLYCPIPFLNCVWKLLGPSPNFASIPADRSSIVLAVPRLLPAHPDIWSRLLLFNVSPHLHPSIRTLTSLFSLPKGVIKESKVAILASILGGFGTVAMFCTLGVYV